jgi:flagellin
VALRISSNIASIAAQRHYNKAEQAAEHSLKALASGSRIVQAGDDAAGLAISENLRAQISGIKMAKYNSENAVSMIQVAEGSLNEQTNVLIRLRELGIQAASDTVSDTEREYLELEFTNLVQEFDRIAQSTTFGSRKLLTGSGAEYEFHIGPTSESHNIVKYAIDDDTRAGTLGLDSLSVADKSSARDTMQSLDEALKSLSSVRAKYGAFQSRFNAATNNLAVQAENMSSARARIYDVDVAEETAALAAANIKQNAGVSVLANANVWPERALKLIQNVM